MTLRTPASHRSFSRPRNITGTFPYDHPVIPLLPATIDNTYRGHKIALWIFGVLLFMRLAMSVSSTFNGYSVLKSADGIPLDTYPPAAARTIVTVFALFALSQFVLCALGALVLVRYRSMVPFMFALLLGEHLARRVILQVMPIQRVGSPPGSIINIILLTLTVLGFALSLWRRP